MYACMSFLFRIGRMHTISDVQYSHVIAFGPNLISCDVYPFLFACMSLIATKTRMHAILSRNGLHATDFRRNIPACSCYQPEFGCMRRISARIACMHPDLAPNPACKSVSFEFVCMQSKSGLTDMHAGFGPRSGCRHAIRANIRRMQLNWGW